MTRKISGSALLVFVGLFLGGLLLTPCTLHAEKAVKLKVSVSYPAKHPMTVKAFEVWAKRVEDQTKGDIKVTLFPGSTLSKVNENYDATVAGLCDVSMYVPAYAAARFPLSNAMNLPMLFSSSTSASLAAWDVYQKFPEFQKEYSDTKLLFFYFTPPYEIHTTVNAVNTTEDLKGLQIRTAGPISAKIMEALGASPIAISMPEAYLGLQKGVLDGLVSPFGTMRGFKTADVTSFHTTNAKLFSSAFCVVMNLKKWESLSPENKKALEAVSGAEAARLFGEVFDSLRTPDIQYMEEQGDTFTTIAPEEREKWIMAVKSIRENWVKEMADKGLPGKEILAELIKLSERY
ncbi:MAG: TRAP transporter substrate-binding protein [Deltaproteobacteria bacterium]|nr:TRAP transporter substrate-binding protein [Deltaproteobacteria bacterium]